MKIAVVGAGISGLTAAYVLSPQHEITVFEANDRLGGHTATKDVHVNGRDYAIDTGFIVFNDWTYPNFQKLLAQLDVDSNPTEMGFSVCCEKTGLEYSGTNLNTMFAQRSNLFSVKHWRMIRDILRFNKEALPDVESGGRYLEMTLDEYLQQKKYSKIFTDKYLIPMGAAIWSASTNVMKSFSLHFFVNFFRNHGLLSVSDRPQWRVVKGGSRAYIKPLTQRFKNNIRLNSAVKSIQRNDKGVVIKTIHGLSECFDQVVIAAHSDQALAMLTDASDKEIELLSAIPYQKNEVILHTDISLLPKRRSTWSSWNYRITDERTANESDLKTNKTTPDDQLPVLTYDMNLLQSIASDTTFCVTLNKSDAIDPEKILGTYYYDHPVFSRKSVAAQEQWQTINGVNKTWFCGAYWANGFHEDGVLSALRVAEKLGSSL
ncbi:MAG: putative NAD/FAD-binding protein [Pseudohongiellaceae bacterium]|jgi:predicted NAD/FAD-binding protein